MPSPVAEAPKDSLSRIDNAKKVIDSLCSGWKQIEKTVDENRKMRKLRVDVEELRQRGKLRAGDTYLGVRVIDNNIAKDIPPFIAYIKQSRRLGIFEPVDMNTPRDFSEQVESEFARVLTYPAWEFDYIRWIDGCELHGFEWMSVVYDESKPGGCAVNHTSMSDLLFDVGVKDIQHSRMVIERFHPTLVTLRELAAKNDFDPAVLKELEEKLRERSNSENLDSAAVQLYKIHYKEYGTVYCAWNSPVCADKWLKKPYPFWNGVKQRQDVPVIDPNTGMPMVDPVTGAPVMQTRWNPEYESAYPYYPLIYKVTEDEIIREAQGRGEMDLYIQEGACTIWSSFTNMARRSSMVMWAPDSPNMDGGGAAPKQLDLPLKDGAIWDRKMIPLTTPAPDPMLPKALELLSTQNADNLNQPAWTVNNRQDSRKTATEVTAATQAQSLINSVSVVMFSVGMRLVLNAAWRIVQSQALQERIKFLPGPDGRNRVDVIAIQYSIKAAGDTDVVERQELEMKMQQDWPVMQATPLAATFLEEYIRLRYPNFAERFIQQLRAGDSKKAVIQTLGTLLQQAVTDDSGALLPEWRQFQPQLQQAAQSAAAALQMP